MVERVRLLLKGRVQGVGFRYATEDEAARLGLVGWVRNLRDGRVEVVAEGERAALDDLVAWCRRGPAIARVDDVTVDWGNATGEFKRFSLASTV